VGKSAICRQVFREIASNENKEFREWSDLSIDQKSECIANPDKYWIFADMRTSQMDNTSLTGIPNMAKTDLLENIPYSWVVYFTQPMAHGCIFFDELNLACALVQSITYSVIHDRVISDRRLGENVYVFAAGNRSQDKAHTFDMPLPLRDRFAEFEIEIDVEHWIKWAQHSKLNPHIIAFINWKPANLYNADKVKSDKPATPRGVERASRLLADLDITDDKDDKAHMLVSISCGESFATEFQAYAKVHSQLDWTKIIKDPSKIQEMSLDKQYAISAGVADQFKRKAGDIKFQEKLLDVTDAQREDFAVFSYRTISAADRDGFRKVIDKLNRRGIFANKYARYLLENV